MRGICLTIIEEFDRVLTVGYFSLLPLVRPTASNALLKEQQTRHGLKLLDELRESSEVLLTRPADRVLPNSEVVSRNGLDNNTLNSFGEKALCRPFLQQTRNSLESIINIGTKRSMVDDEQKILKKMKLNELKQLAREENVELSTDVTKRKQLIINAIIEARRTRSEPNENVDQSINNDNQATELDNVVGVTNTMDTRLGDTIPQECMELRVLRTNTLSQLLAMASKEQVCLRGKRSSKDTVVKAIYHARQAARGSQV